MSNVALSSPSLLDGRLKLAPGIIAAVVVSLASVFGGRIEEQVFGRPIIEPLVLAILIGMAIRTLTGAWRRGEPGVYFVAKDVLEVSVFLLGATMDVPRLFASGPALAAGIVVIVCFGLTVGVLIGRAVGLSKPLSILVACGNAICGNSAIAAVAPVIGAEREDVASSIALTAVLGVAVVLGLPLLIKPLGYTNYQYGVLAGLTVYAVPQVLAAAFAVSPLSGQVATVVKLARVLMLGPVVLFFALRNHNPARHGTLKFTRLVPWFVLGFVVLATLRSTGAINDATSNGAKVAAGWLMIAAMAGLGLSVDVRAVRQVGVRVGLAVCGSLATLLILTILMIHMLAVR